ncbi:hypothetical protein HW132_31990 [Brasilonema sp. CT11]|nr:hypothetical protein [Brasilonema sp. CT11]
MNTRQHKKLYERFLGREVSDQTWYRIRASLKRFEIAESQYDKALPILAKLKKNHASLPILQSSFLEVWEIIVKAENQLNKPSLTCSEFKDWLIKGMKLQPHKSQVYKWFGYAGCPFRKEQSYPLTDLVCVAAFAYTWQSRKTKRIATSEALNILDCEIV